MAKPRKTVEVDTVRKIANDMLAYPGDILESNKVGRTAIAVMLERILMDTGNYKGFRYLEVDHSRNYDGSTPRTTRIEQLDTLYGDTIEVDAGVPYLGDETRRYYF